MAEHEGGGGAQSQFVRSFHNRKPFSRRHLVRAYALPHLIIENFGGSAREAAKPRGHQFGKEFAHCHLERRSAVAYLERREGVHVYLRNRAFGGADDGEVRFAGI